MAVRPQLSRAARQIEENGLRDFLRQRVRGDMAASDRVNQIDMTCDHGRESGLVTLLRILPEQLKVVHAVEHPTTLYRSFT